ncbi:MAG: endonuclease/exonuclease/phosphatase [Magnetococcales bacterium]|nr:endonuclease/exonuclease/phosphatase family protein [Magnetococcales bacterium]NGZ28530.1 endonuclease/exonuclease/phosphatase [Magnetococcales bacterium]
MPQTKKSAQSLRVATFNVENLFARYNFKQADAPVQTDGFTINDLAFRIMDDQEKALTGKVITEANGDIIALQEVESLEVLDRFCSDYLAGMNYQHRILIDSHDPRRIDVALLSRYPLANIRTHRQDRNSNNSGWLFSRDCLEVEVAVKEKVLHLYVNHFKSKLGSPQESDAKRLAQAKRVAELVDLRWKKEQYQGNFIILGDLNDFPTSAPLAPLVKHPDLVNVVERLPKEERWTHYYAGDKSYNQIDYLLLSKALANKNANPPTIVRSGLPLRASRHTGPRLPGVGQDRPKASDHSALVMELVLV